MYSFFICHDPPSTYIYTLSLHDALPILWKYLAWFYSKCEKVFVPSSSMIEVLKENIIPADFTIWARGIETDLFHPSRSSEKWREELGFGRDDHVISYVAKLVWAKANALISVV